MPRILKRRYGFFACFLVLSFSPVGAQSPQVQVTPSALDFGIVLLGESASRAVVLQNVGDAPLDITRIAVESESTDDFSIPDFSLPVTLVAGGQFTTQVTYTPDLRGPDQSSLVIETSVASQPQPALTVPLSGSGEPPLSPAITVTPSSLEFGGKPIGSTSSKTVTIRNAGSGVLSVSTLTLTQGPEQSFEVGQVSLPVLLIRNRTAQIRLLYRPLDEVPDFAWLRIESNDLAHPVTTVSISGRGIPVTGPEIVVSPSSLDFGAVSLGIPSSLSLTISNNGLSQLVITEIVLETDSSPSFAITGGPETATLTVGATVTVEVTYIPSAESSDIGSLRIESNDVAHPHLAVTLSGTGILPVFRRGDANSDGDVDISDAVSVLGQLFGTVPLPLCLDASDANDDGTVDVSDAVFTLVWLFTDDNLMPAPGVESCGVDPSEDDLEPCGYPAEVCE